ncbi:hypothetical protein WMF26_24990 [Sorangium sp. So ce185]|uniref:hypothetical protein n=1 Tax=Sorangium sp. So ce185 TaxID=3133287 RepID=UPI003F639EA0
MTSTSTARMLSIGTTTLRRIEGTLFEPAPRQGSRKMRVFTPEQVDVLRIALREQSRLDHKPELVGLEELAHRAACSMQTIRRRLGTELPAGRKLSQGPRAKWGFTPREASKIVAWVKRHVRRRRRWATGPRD